MNQFGVHPRSAFSAPAAEIQQAVESGYLRRIHRGWYATPEAHATAITARKVGGLPTAQSLFSLQNVWHFRDHRLHVQVPHSRGRVHPERVRAECCIHYLPTPSSDREATLRACQAISFCSPLEDVVAAIDSCLNQRLLTLDELAAGGIMTTRLRQALRLADPNSQSGLETRMRLFLRSHNIRYQTQVQVLANARVDFVLGRRLIVEVDGYQYHSVEQFDSDRRRDLELVKRGYRVVRASYNMMTIEWSSTQRQLLEIVHRREHLLEPRWIPSAG